MAQITMTFDLTPETLEILKLLAGASTGKTEKTGKAAPEPEQLSFDDLDSGKDKKSAKKTAAKDKKAAAPKEEPVEEKDDAPEITLTDVRAVALKLSKAGKQKLLKLYGELYDIKRVRMSIIQPRINREPSTDEISVTELLDWAENYVKPRAALAFAGKSTLSTTTAISTTAPESTWSKAINVFFTGRARSFSAACSCSNRNPAERR